ncbi:MAG: hypothetical protein RL248_322 [Pseudomonadota bacterium]
MTLVYLLHQIVAQYFYSHAHGEFTLKPIDLIFVKYGMFSGFKLLQLNYAHIRIIGGKNGLPIALSPFFKSVPTHTNTYSFIFFTLTMNACAQGLLRNA